MSRGKLCTRPARGVAGGSATSPLESETAAPAWEFRRTGLVLVWSTLMQWRYVRVLAFAWLVLGYSHGWAVAAEPFGPLVVAITGCLAAVALLDAGRLAWRLVERRSR